MHKNISGSAAYNNQPLSTAATLLSAMLRPTGTGCKVNCGRSGIALGFLDETYELKIQRKVHVRVGDDSRAS